MNIVTDWLTRWLYTLKPIPKRQLLRRLYLQIKRPVLNKLARPAQFYLKIRCPATVNTIDDHWKFLQNKLLIVEHDFGQMHADASGYQFDFLQRRVHLPHGFNWRDEKITKQCHLWIFHLHYMNYLAAADNSTFCALVRSWIDTHPPYQTRYHFDGWSSYALSIRTVNWMRELLKRRDHLSSDLLQLMLRSLQQQILFLTKNLETDIGGNHLLKNLKALLMADVFFNQTQATTFTQHWQRLQKQLQLQILADGCHYERSLAYHCQVFVDLIELAAILPEAMKIQLLATAEKMLPAIVQLTHPNGSAAAIGDGCSHNEYSPEACLKAWQRISARPIPTVSEYFFFPQAGYYGVHQTSHFLVVDAAPIGPDALPAHGHADVFSFEWSICGVPFIVDTGTFDYQSKRYRARARSTAAHNTVTLDHRDQAQMWSSFRVGRRPKISILSAQNATPASAGWHFSAMHNGYCYLPGQPIHHRSFDLQHSHLKITDQIENGAGQRALCYLHIDEAWQVQLPTQIEASGNTLQFTHPSGLQIQLKLASGARYCARTAVCFPKMGEIKAVTELQIDYGHAPCCGILNFSWILPCD